MIVAHVVRAVWQPWVAPYLRCMGNLPLGEKAGIEVGRFVGTYGLTFIYEPKKDRKP